jgi:hypothetical protein
VDLSCCLGNPVIKPIFMHTRDEKEVQRKAARKLYLAASLKENLKRRREHNVPALTKSDILKSAPEPRSPEQTPLVQNPSAPSSNEG